MSICRSLVLFFSNLSPVHMHIICLFKKPTCIHIYMYVCVYVCIMRYIYIYLYITLLYANSPRISIFGNNYFHHTHKEHSVNIMWRFYILFKMWLASWRTYKYKPIRSAKTPKRSEQRSSLRQQGSTDSPLLNRSTISSCGTTMKDWKKLFLAVRALVCNLSREP